MEFTTFIAMGLAFGCTIALFVMPFIKRRSNDQEPKRHHGRVLGLDESDAIMHREVRKLKKA